MRRRLRAIARREGSAPGVPRLVQRFAATIAVSFIIVMFAVVVYVRYSATERATQTAQAHAEFVALTTLRDILVEEDFTRPYGSERLGELDRLLGQKVLVGEAEAIKLYRPDGKIVYATDHSLIGTRELSDEFKSAVAGTPKTEVGSLAGDGSNDTGGASQKALEAYVPFRFWDGAKPVGVFEVYQSYAPVAAAARSEYLSVAIVLAIGMAALFVSLVPALRRVTRRLDRYLGEIHHQALHDSLTGLPNRELFRDRLEHAIALARREAGTSAVLLIDLDRFKEINDTLGHQSGDSLLEQIGVTLSAAVREVDTVARLGGDEFAVVAPRTDAEGALQLADRLRAALAKPSTVMGIDLEIDASVGIAVFPEHGADTDTLLRHADVALYLSKDAHAPSLYAEEHDHYSPERLALVTDLRRAVSSGEELVVYFQPQADLRSGHIVRAEALVRWQHPERGLLGPDVFLPLAEHTGLMRPLTRTVLDASVRQCRAWRDIGLDVAVAVNVSGRDLLDVGLPDEVEATLQRFGVPADRLELEITENTILTDPLRARAVLARLSELGVSLAIDDFGAGYSSLGYLKRLPVDVLKIDRSFVMNMSNDANDAVIVRSTIDLGHNLGLRVVAEGVEDELAMQTLGDLDCDIAQGYYLGRPVPAEELLGILTKSARQLDVIQGASRAAAR